MYSLPEDVLENVLGFLTARELATAMCTAKFLRDAAQSRHLWQAHLAQNFRKFDVDEVRVGHLWHARTPANSACAACSRSAYIGCTGNSLSSTRGAVLK